MKDIYEVGFLHQQRLNYPGEPLHTILVLLTSCTSLISLLPDCVAQHRLRLENPLSSAFAASFPKSQLPAKPRTHPLSVTFVKPITNSPRDQTPPAPMDRSERSMRRYTVISKRGRRPYDMHNMSSWWPVKTRLITLRNDHHPLESGDYPLHFPPSRCSLPL